MKLLALLSLASAALAVYTSPSQPAKPALTFLFNATLNSAQPIVIGATPSGQRVIVPITGGSFTGPKLKGKVLQGLASVVNSLKADATYVLQTGDGATIVVTERAVLPNVEVEFETGSQTYAWLNNITAWATGTETNQAAALNFWQIGS